MQSIACRSRVLGSRGWQERRSALIKSADTTVTIGAGVVAIVVAAPAMTMMMVAAVAVVGTLVAPECSLLTIQPATAVIVALEAVVVAQ
jgi:hypothetical protein